MRYDERLRRFRLVSSLILLAGGLAALCAPVSVLAAPAITGVFPTSGTVVAFGGIAATAIVVTSTTQLTARTLPHLAGAVTVTVTNPDASTASLPNAYTFTLSGSPPPAAIDAFFQGSGGVERVALGADGNLWFTATIGNQIGRITPAGVITMFSVPTASGSPSGIAAGADGNLWFVEGANKIGRINPFTATTAAPGIVEFSIPTTNSGTREIAAGPDGNLWFTEFAGRIGKINPTTGAITQFSAGITGGSSPLGLTVGSDGNLWFTERNGNRIGRITAAGAVTEFALPTASSIPQEIAPGPDGNLWFADVSAKKVGVLFVAPPTVTAIAPTTGPANTAQPVTIFGLGFAPGATVSFGGSACTGITVVNPTAITCTTPALPPGTVDVTVTNPGPVSGTRRGYTYGVPNPLPNPEPSGGTPGAPNPLPNPRAAGGAQTGSPAPLPNSRP